MTFSPGSKLCRLPLEYPGIPYVVAISNQVFSRKEKRKSFRRLETVFATGTPINKGTPMMRTFDERNLGKRPPHFLILLRKTSGDGYVWTVREISRT